jgi:hypothetical protein
MAEAKPLRFDDFVGAVRSDPARSEPLVMLTGYVGKSDSDGKLRIYSDASLNHWHEAAVDDVVHSSPIADSPLGGSNLWLRATAAITPGAAAPLPPEPGAGDEGRPEARAAAVVPTMFPQCRPTMFPPCVPTMPLMCMPTSNCMPTAFPFCNVTHPPMCF